MKPRGGGQQFIICTPFLFMILENGRKSASFPMVCFSQSTILPNRFFGSTESTESSSSVIVDDGANKEPRKEEVQWPNVFLTGQSSIEREPLAQANLSTPISSTCLQTWLHLKKTDQHRRSQCLGRLAKLEREGMTSLETFMKDAFCS